MTQHVSVADMSMPHRLASATVTVTDAAGAARPNADLVVRQLGHDFLFGNILFDYIDWANAVSTSPVSTGSTGVVGGSAGVSPATGRATSSTTDLARDEAELAAWRELFNFGTLPFYWRYFEPVPGAPDTRRLLTAARRFQSMGIALKGHPLAWHTLAPKWLLDGTTADTERTLRARITRDVTDFAGLVDVWDAINEAVIMPVFEAEANAVTPLCRAKGRIATVRLAFEVARSASPHATLLINDFDLSSAYECLIEGVLAAGVKIDAIGLQTHMQQGYRGDEAIAAMLERFARYGLPLHMTEASLVSGHLMPPEIVDLNDYQVDEWPSTTDGEARQAGEIVSFYRTVLAQPAVEAVTYWGLTDRTAWLHAPIGLLRADGTPKPAYDALHGLIKGLWWVPATPVTTDDAGRFELTGFKGDYEVVDVAGQGTAGFHLGTSAAVNTVL